MIPITTGLCQAWCRVRQSSASSPSGVFPSPAMGESGHARTFDCHSLHGCSAWRLTWLRPCDLDALTDWRAHSLCPDIAEHHMGRVSNRRCRQMQDLAPALATHAVGGEK